ncbi:hypothetical protein Scep_022505 [Stephania cephalantha]|uniref:O-methyltransferase C-terminal domain-containing protein n=1 Tax=Stephania cephalantha TaxID=152367 RepID=A0AAP0I278_9MAGN
MSAARGAARWPARSRWSCRLRAEAPSLFAAPLPSPLSFRSVTLQLLSVTTSRDFALEEPRILQLGRARVNESYRKPTNYVAKHLSRECHTEKSVLHNHEDDVCIKILNKCKEAILRGGSKKGKVILVEIVLDIEDRPELTNIRFGVDLRMVSTGGKERSKKEWADLFYKVGFSRHEIIPIAALESIVVLYP